jgi:hypothetical protein
MTERWRQRTGKGGEDDRAHDDSLGVVRSLAHGVDLPTDRQLTLTARQLARIVIVAAETAERFVREDLDGDPVGWMYSSLRLHEGRRPVEACRTRDGFSAALVLHGIFKVNDSHPEDIQALFRPRPS